MVYRAGHKAFNAEPVCGCCTEELGHDETVFYVNVERASAAGETPTGLHKGEDHLCEGCQEDFNLLRGVDSLVYKIVNDKLQIIELRRNSARKCDIEWYTPDTAPDEVLSLFDTLSDGFPFEVER